MICHSGGNGGIGIGIGSSSSVSVGIGVSLSTQFGSDIVGFGCNIWSLCRSHDEDYNETYRPVVKDPRKYPVLIQNNQNWWWENVATIWQLDQKRNYIKTKTKSIEIDTDADASGTAACAAASRGASVLKVEFFSPKFEINPRMQSIDIISENHRNLPKTQEPSKQATPLIRSLHLIRHLTPWFESPLKRSVCQRQHFLSHADKKRHPDKKLPPLGEAERQINHANSV